MDQNELVSKKLLSTANLGDDEAVAAAVIASKYSFWNGSYAETYGSVTSGGVHIYLSDRDAEYVVGSQR